jgi:glycosyltransferase involved in cell wall biosynthesis
MKSLAYIEPVAGLNVYGRELLPYLSCHYEIEVVTDPESEEVAAEVADFFRILQYSDLATRRNQYDHFVFQLRNNPRHVPVYNLLMEIGGVIVMHEITMLGIIGSQTLRQGRRLDFLRQVWCNEGAATAVRAGADLFLLRQGTRRLEHLLMNRLAVRKSQGIIVHNMGAEQVLRRRYPYMPVRTIRRGVPPAQSFDKTALRQELALVDRWPIIASFGVIAARKRIAQVLEALADVVREFPRALYVLVGQIFDLDVEGMVNQLGLSDHVLLPGRVDDETFHKYLSITDIGVNLRYPSEGETSSTALRLLSYGKPVLVTSDGSLAELPDSCTIKIIPGPDEVFQIREGLLRLARDEAFRLRMGEAAFQHVASQHTWEGAAQGYWDFLESRV